MAGVIDSRSDELDTVVAIQMCCGVALRAAYPMHPKSLFQTAFFSATPAKQGVAAAISRVFMQMDGDLESAILKQLREIVK